MRRLLLVLMLLASPAFATTWYVSPRNTPSDTANPGNDSTANKPYATIAKAMSVAQPGDIVRILGGTYAEGLRTVRSGTTSAWITVTGDCAVPNNAVLTGGNITFHHDFISIRGLKITGAGKGVEWVKRPYCVPDDCAPYSAARNDSLSWCHIVPSDTLGTIAFGSGTATSPAVRTVDYRKLINIVLYGNTIVCRNLYADVNGDGYYYITSRCPDANGLCYTAGDSSRHRFWTIRKNRIYLLRGEVGQPGIFLMRGVQMSTIDSNDVTITWKGPALRLSDGSIGVSGWRKFYFMSNCLIADNHWHIEDRRATADTSFYVYQRDSSWYNNYVRDTMDVNSQNVELNVFSNSGNTGDATHPNSNGADGHSKYTNCVWRCPLQRGPAWQANMSSDSLYGCTVASAGVPLLWVAGISGDNVIDHCTFADSVTGGGLKIGTTGLNRPWTGTFKLKSNIFYSKDKLGTNRSAVNFTLPRGGPLESDYNFYVMYDTSAVFGDRSITYYTTEADGSLPGTLMNSRPDSTTWRTLTWGQYPLPDLHSRFAGRAAGTQSPVLQSGRAKPAFADSNIATFDPHIVAGSGALTIGEGGSDAGGFQLTTPDVVRPDDPQDLYILGIPLTDAVTFEFTASGDDSLTGRAHHYDVRYSTSTITAGNFDAATVFLASQTPALPQTIDRITVTGLAATTTYYFALKVVDDAGNKSAVSSVISARTAGAGGGTQFTEP